MKKTPKDLFKSLSENWEGRFGGGFDATLSGLVSYMSFAQGSRLRHATARNHGLNYPTLLGLAGGANEQKLRPVEKLPRPVMNDSAAPAPGRAAEFPQRENCHLSTRTTGVGCHKAVAGLVAGLLFVNAAWGAVNYATPYTFTTIAGSAGNIQNQDGTNNSALFGTPTGMTLDTNGNLYVVDFYFNTIRKIAFVGNNRVVTTIAGSAVLSGSNNGTNGNALFNGPSGITADGAGNLYVSDANNNIIRLMTPVGTNWVVSTIAGTANSIGGTNDGMNGAAQFNYPNGIAVDTTGSNVYVADSDNHTIRWLAHVGTNWVVTTIAGNANSPNGGSSDGTNLDAQFIAPWALAFDTSSNLLVADSGNSAIRKMTPVGTNWVTTTIAGTLKTAGNDDGTNGGALFSTPYGLAVDASNDVFVADVAANNVRKLTPAGTNWVSSTLAGSANYAAGPPTTSTGFGVRFDFPWGIAVDAAGDVFVTDSGNNVIRKGDAAGIPKLAISLTSSNSVLVSWPAYSIFNVLTNADLSTTNWGLYGGVVATDTNGISSVNLPVSAGNSSLFFHLSY